MRCLDLADISVVPLPVCPRSLAHIPSSDVRLQYDEDNPSHPCPNAERRPSRTHRQKGRRCESLHSVQQRLDD